VVEQSCSNCGKQFQIGDEVCRFCGFVFPFSTVVIASGRTLQGRYEIQELIHSGGMGYIYLAKDKRLYDRLCIVKQAREAIKSETHQKKLEEEALRMAKLNHPNIAMIFDHFVEGGYYFLVVEHISGKTLSEVFKEHNGQLTENEVVRWAISLCDVVSYLNREGVIHRDISPDNIMITEGNSIKFIDFGTLREFRYLVPGGTVGIGKYGYTPPEQWRGKPEPRSDIFALGATIYYLLTGFLPLSQEYLTGQAPQKEDFNPDFPPIRTKNPNVSPQLEAILQRALQLDVNSRFPSAIEFGQALRSLGQVVTEQAVVPVPTVKKIAKPSWLWSGVALLSFGLGWQIFMGWAATPSQEDNFYGATLLALTWTILCAYFVKGALAQSHLNKRVWLWTATVLLVVGLGLPFIVIGLLLSDGMMPHWYFMLPVLLALPSPFIVLGIYCLRWGLAQVHPARLAEERKLAVSAERPAEAEKVVTRPVWFWLGLLVFGWSEAFGWAMFMSWRAAEGRYPPDPPMIALAIPGVILGIVCILLSRRKLRHRWFWPGVAMFSYGLTAVPQWLHISLNVARFPNVPRDDPMWLPLSIGAFSVPAIIGGALCLWRGWPRTGVRHPRGELFGFIFSSCIICLALSLGVIASMGPSQRDILSFSDNFEDGVADGWKLDPGWGVVDDNGNHVLDGQGQDSQNAWPRVTSAEDYLLEAHFQLISGLFQFEVRSTYKSKTGYIVWVYQDRVNLGKNTGGNLIDLAGTAAEIGFKRWHRIDIALNGGNIKVYIDDELKIDYWDNEPLPAGSFGISSHQGSWVRLDNILVKPYADSTSAPPPAPLPTPLPNN